MWIVRKKLGISIASSEGSKFLKFPNLKFIRVDETVVLLAQNLMEQYKIKPRDAIHAATAVSNEIKHFVSDDPDFDAIKEIKRVPIEKFSQKYN